MVEAGITSSGFKSSGIFGLHMLYNEVLHLNTCTDGMFDLHMLYNEVSHLNTLGICTYEMSYLNTSITGMFNLHMLCKGVFYLPYAPSNQSKVGAKLWHPLPKEGIAETGIAHSLWLWSTGFATLVTRQPE